MIDTLNVVPVANRVRYPSSLDTNVIILAEDSPVPLSHLISRLSHKVFFLINSSGITVASTFRLVLFLLLVLINPTHVAFSKEYLRVMLLSVERIDILAGVLVGIPVKKEDLLELVASGAHRSLLGVLNDAHVLALDKLHFFIFYQILLFL